MKKIIALLLATIMLFSVVPVAFAENAETDGTIVAAEADDSADESLSGAGDLFGGFFIKIGELLQIIFDFLANLFNGTGDTNIDFM